jgi:hypothetical protein
MPRLELGPRRYRPASFGGLVVRIADDLRKCVVFIGTGDAPEHGGFRAIGTAFLLRYDSYGYLVTVRHTADFFDDDPFLLRFNRMDGTADTVSVDVLADGVSWHIHPDDDVDLAAMPLNSNFAALGIESLYLPDERLLNSEKLSAEDVGVGDLCYTIGLFRLMAGKLRNLPVVHTGNIAALASDEKVPVKAWLRTDGTQYVEGYLVETHALDGLSGSPVFVRPVAGWTGISLKAGGVVPVHLPKSEPLLLGVWQSSWDVPPEVVMSTGRRLPLGIGVVVPAVKLIELLELPELRKGRDEYRQRVKYNEASTPDAGQKPS